MFFLLWSGISRGEAKLRGRAQDAKGRGAVKTSRVGLKMGNSGGEREVDAFPSPSLHPPKCKINRTVCKVQVSCLQRSSNIIAELCFYEVA